MGHQLGDDHLGLAGSTRGPLERLAEVKREETQDITSGSVFLEPGLLVLLAGAEYGVPFSLTEPIQKGFGRNSRFDSRRSLSAGASLADRHRPGMATVEHNEPAQRRDHLNPVGEDFECDCRTIDVVRVHVVRDQEVFARVFPFPSVPREVDHGCRFRVSIPPLHQPFQALENPG